MPAVSFDLDGTLLECAEPRERSFRRAAAALEDPIEPPAVEAYRAAFRAELRSRLPERAPERPVRRAAIRRAIGADGGDDPPRSAIAALEGAYRRRRLERLRVIEGAGAVLEGLRDAGIEVAVVTNGPAGLQREKLQRGGLEPLVDAVAVAGECGAAKPDPKPFAVAFDRLDSSPAGAVHVGDAAADVRGAQAAGLDPVLLDRGGDGPTGPSVPTCDSLEAVAELLDAYPE